jgi:hypothetical protein
MKRGIVKLTDHEISYLLGLFSGLEAPLLNKLKAAAKDEMLESQVELSEQELENIMDALPAPGETSVADDLRLKLDHYFKLIVLEQKPPLVNAAQT